MYNLKQGRTNFEPIPDGRYSLKIDSVSVTPHTKGEQDGHRFEVAFTITDGDHKGRKVWDNIYLPWVTWKMCALLEAGGAPTDDENATPESIIAALTGLEVSAYIVTTTGSNDKPRSNLSDYTAISKTSELNFERLR
jgi:hypothetical protein